MNVDDFMAGRIRKEEYQAKRIQLTGKSAEIEAKIKETEEWLKSAEQAKDTEIPEVLDILDRFSGENGLTAGMADALVKRVIVYTRGRMEIEWNFSENAYRFITGE